MGFLFSKDNENQIPNNNIGNEVNEIVPVNDNDKIELRKKDNEIFLCLKIYLQNGLNP